MSLYKLLYLSLKIIPAGEGRNTIEVFTHLIMGNMGDGKKMKNIAAQYRA